VGNLIARGRGNVPVNHHQFHVADTGIGGGSGRQSDTGLVSTAPGVIVIFTGISMGVADVSVETYDSRPLEAEMSQSWDIGSWDEVVETNLFAPHGRAVVTGVGADAPELPLLSSAGIGNYRVRVYAKGRDTAPDLVRTEPVETYLIASWPSPPVPERIYKQSDRYGETMRQSAKLNALGAVQSDPVMRARDAILRKMLGDGTSSD
jgi:hypothetical protein